MDIVINTDQDLDGAYVTFAMRFMDNVDEQPTANCSYLSGSKFPIGETIVTCNVSDSSNNVNSCSFWINITGKKFSKQLNKTAIQYISRASF